MNKISAVVINYNGREYLERSLGELTKHSELNEIIVVDDASTDGSKEFVREKFPTVLLIVSPKNRGPVFSRQIGFEKANGDYIVFIDCDVLIQKDTISRLYEFLKSNDDFWLAGAKLNDNDGTDISWNYGHFPNVWKNFFQNFLRRDLYIAKETKEVDWVAEACFIVKSGIFKKIGGFDLNFFMYHEAPDISLRARKIGYKTSIIFEAKATHLGQKSRKEYNDRFYLFNEGIKYFYKKHYNMFAYLEIYILISFYYLLRKFGIKFKTHYE